MAVDIANIGIKLQRLVFIRYHECLYLRFLLLALCLRDHLKLASSSHHYHACSFEVDVLQSQPLIKVNDNHSRFITSIGVLR